jgi:predicted transcriptional regulator
MGRRKLYEVAVHFRITEELERRLEAIAGQSTSDLSAVMRQALEDYASKKETEMQNDGTRTGTTGSFAGS